MYYKTIFVYVYVYNSWEISLNIGKILKIFKGYIYPYHLHNFIL